MVSENPHLTFDQDMEDRKKAFLESPHTIIDYITRKHTFETIEDHQNYLRECVAKVGEDEFLVKFRGEQSIVCRRLKKSVLTGLIEGKFKYDRNTKKKVVEASYDSKNFFSASQSNRYCILDSLVHFVSIYPYAEAYEAERQFVISLVPKTRNTQDTDSVKVFETQGILNKKEYLLSNEDLSANLGTLNRGVVLHILEEIGFIPYGQGWKILCSLFITNCDNMRDIGTADEEAPPTQATDSEEEEEEEKEEPKKKQPSLKKRPITEEEEEEPPKKKTKKQTPPAQVEEEPPKKKAKKQTPPPAASAQATDEEEEEEEEEKDE